MLDYFLLSLYSPINLFSSFQLRAVWISLSTFADFTYTMGWLVRCEESHAFFSPRFLHVLMFFSSSGCSLTLHTLLKTLTTSSFPPLSLTTISAGTTCLIREGYRMYSLHKTCVLSVSGEGLLKRSRLEFMRQLTHWYSIFPIDFTSVIPCLCDIF